MSRLIIVILLLICIFSPSQVVYAAGQGGVDIAVLNAGVGARALGMGGAFTALSDNADSPYWNPAGLGFLSSYQITTMQTKLATDTDHYYVSYVQPLWGGGLGISWIQVGLGEITRTSTPSAQTNEVPILGIFSYFSSAYLISYGRQFSDNLSFGLTMKYLVSDMDQTINPGGYGSGYSLTPGLLYKYSSQITFGLRIDEALNEQRWQSGAVEKVRPTARFGMLYDLGGIGKLTFDASQILSRAYSAVFAFGYEWRKEIIALRCGYQEGLSFGAGFTDDHTSIDYAYVVQNELSRNNVHRVSLTGKW